MSTFQEQLKDLNACDQAVRWVGDRDAATAWAECQRADWMLWLVNRLVDRKKMAFCLCEIARTALQYVNPGDDEPRQAIEAAEAYLRGKATATQALAAAEPARRVGSHTEDWQTYVYLAAVRAVDYAVSSYIGADECAAYAAYAAPNSKDAYATLAEIVRKHFPVNPWL